MELVSSILDTRSGFRSGKRGIYVCMYILLVCMYVFIKLHITTQSGPVILVILCMYVCVVYIFIT